MAVLSAPLPKFQSRRFAMGGDMPAGAPMPQGPPQGAPQGPPSAGGDPAAQGGAPDPAAQLQAAATQYAQTKDPQLAVQIADMVVEVMGVGAGAPAPGGGDPMAGGGAPMGDPMAGGGAPQMNKKGGKLPAFGKKTQPGQKPSFGAPAKDVPGKGNPFGNKDAAPFQKGGKSAGKPMSADQKIKARRDAAKMAKK